MSGWATGTRNGSTKLSERDVLRIWARLMLGDSRRVIASDFCVSIESVRNIARGISWGWLTSPRASDFYDGVRCPTCHGLTHCTGLLIDECEDCGAEIEVQA